MNAIIDYLKNLSTTLDNFSGTLTFKDVEDLIKNHANSISETTFKDAIQKLANIYFIEKNFNTHYELFTSMYNLFINNVDFYHTDLIYDFLAVLRFFNKPYVHYYLRSNGSHIKFSSDLTPNDNLYIQYNEKCFVLDKYGRIIRQYDLSNNELKLIKKK